jgi:Fe-S cluster biosynthesis and repair protein YggX
MMSELQMKLNKRKLESMDPEERKKLEEVKKPV